MKTKLFRYYIRNEIRKGSRHLSRKAGGDLGVNKKTPNPDIHRD